MPKKLTTYSRPSLADQIKHGGKITLEGAEKLCADLEKAGASAKTLKKLRAAIENRVWA